MALSEKHRSSIYQHLAELLGDEEADALLSQFPARDLDEPVTKDFVRAEIADIRTEVGALRGELAERFRQLTMWMTGTMITGLGVMTAVVAAIS